MLNDLSMIGDTPSSIQWYHLGSITFTEYYSHISFELSSGNENVPWKLFIELMSCNSINLTECTNGFINANIDSYLMSISNTVSPLEIRIMEGLSFGALTELQLYIKMPANIGSSVLKCNRDNIFAYDSTIINTLSYTDVYLTSKINRLHHNNYNF